MKNTCIIHLTQEIAGYLLVFLFTYTGVSKLMDRSSFEAVLLQSPLVMNYAIIISWLLPVVEIVIAILLLWKKYRITGLVLSLIVLVIFTIYIGYMILYIPSLPCSCGGVLKELSWRSHILFNLFFIILTLISLSPLSVNKIFIAINRKSRRPV